MAAKKKKNDLVAGRRDWGDVGRGRPATVNMPDRLLMFVESQAQRRHCSRSEIVVEVLLAWARRNGFSTAA